MGFAPTEEQQLILDAFSRGEELVIQAAAGAGKTSSLKLLAESAPNKKFLYVAFNKAIATEAQQKFPSNVSASTAHSLAYRAVGHKYRSRLNTSRIPFATVTRFLGIESQDIPTHTGEFKNFNSFTLTRLVNETVSNFCKTDKSEITEWDVPTVVGLDPMGENGYQERGIGHTALAAYIMPFAHKAWEDLQKTEGTLRFTHDHYLKMWAMSNPTLPGDVLLIDEAQDLNSLLQAVSFKQHQMQKVFVGDSAQATYGFTGATDCLEKFEETGATVLTLSQSFRFGQPVANAANEILDLLNQGEMRVKGFDQIKSSLEDVDAPRAVLTRTNAGALKEIAAMQGLGKKVCLVGGTDTIVKFINAAVELQDRGKTSHVELSLFKSWDELKQYVDQDPDGKELTMLVNLVDQNEPSKLLQAMNSCVSEDSADVIISTAHKSKGREFESVRISSDFQLVKEHPETGERSVAGAPELMLGYVALTRAQNRLDPGLLLIEAEEAKKMLNMTTQSELV